MRKALHSLGDIMLSLSEDCLPAGEWWLRSNSKCTIRLVMASEALTGMFCTIMRPALKRGFLVLLSCDLMPVTRPNSPSNRSFCSSQLKRFRWWSAATCSLSVSLNTTGRLLTSAILRVRPGKVLALGLNDSPSLPSSFQRKSTMSDLPLPASPTTSIKG